MWVIWISTQMMWKYIEGWILQEPLLAQLVKADHSLQDSIVDKIVLKANGMYVAFLTSTLPQSNIELLKYVVQFLMAKLHMDSLASRLHWWAVHDALESLPSKVNATYDEAMIWIKAQNKDVVELADQVLCWITHACWPLSFRIPWLCLLWWIAWTVKLLWMKSSWHLCVVVWLSLMKIATSFTLFISKLPYEIRLIFHRLLYTGIFWK